MTVGPTRIGPLVLLAAVAFALTTAALQLRQAAGAATPTPPPVAALVTGALAVAILVVAWPVRRWNAGERDRSLNPLRAARTVALAKAGALSGAVLTGGWLGFVGVALPVVTLTSQPGRVAASGAVVVASLALTVAGLLAERWCILPPDDGDAGGGDPRARAPRRGHGEDPSPA